MCWNLQLSVNKIKLFIFHPNNDNEKYKKMQSLRKFSLSQEALAQAILNEWNLFAGQVVVSVLIS